jgi:hypothetical protein
MLTVKAGRRRRLYFKRRRAVVAAVMAAAVALGLVLGLYVFAGSSPTAGGKCTLRSTGEMIIWESWPTIKPNAIELGDVDPVACRPLLDTWAKALPTAAGYCSEIAWASDNPGYDAGAIPARPLRHVLARRGRSCPPAR